MQTCQVVPYRDTQPCKNTSQSTYSYLLQLNIPRAQITCTKIMFVQMRRYEIYISAKITLDLFFVDKIFIIGLFPKIKSMRKLPAIRYVSVQKQTNNLLPINSSK